MAKMSFLQARQLLRDACQHYLAHNKAQLDELLGQAPSRDVELRFEFWFFNHAIGKAEPDPGFHDWVACQYYVIWEKLLSDMRDDKNLFWENMDVGLLSLRRELGYRGILQDRLKSGEEEIFHRIKLLRGIYNLDYLFDSESGESSESSENDGSSKHGEHGEDKEYYWKQIDHHDPKIVLHNLQALFDLLHRMMIARYHPDFDGVKRNYNYCEVGYLYEPNEPFSLKINKTFKHFHTFAHFVAGLPENKPRNIDFYCAQLNKMRPIFDGYIKGLAVAELQTMLADPSLSDEEAIKQVEVQLGNEMTIEILKRNRQSSREQNLKLLSVISILIGIGIFTTLGLVFKRLYDSGGTSINFFKPLSEDLYNTLTATSADTAEELTRSECPSVH